jgi:thioredoxin-like negative regulator of GroEL
MLVWVLTVVAGGLFGVGWKWREVRRYRRSLADIKQEIANARFGIAARKLDDFLRWRPDSDEALYLLGLCEKRRGRADAAARAWDAIPPSSTLAPQAIAGRVKLLIERKRFADAEQFIKGMPKVARVDSILLGPVYCQQGRFEEAERLIEARWQHLNQMGEGGSEKAIDLVRMHIELRRKSPPIDAIRAFFNQAAVLAPEDDRIWLGRANLAIRAGSHDEAARLLDACLRRRPDDSAVWRARLRWAMATARVAEARAALQHLPATESNPAEVQKLAVWFGRQRGDVEAERRALERLNAADPADFQALDRLVELAVKEGRQDRAAELRRKKTATERLQARYQKLYQRNQPWRDAAEMARLALELGRSFEAEVFLTVAVAVDTNRDDLRRDLSRLKLRAETSDRLHGTLDAVLAPELDLKASIGRGDDGEVGCAVDARSR